jgi:hypothetical protein
LGGFKQMTGMQRRRFLQVAALSGAGVLVRPAHAITFAAFGTPVKSALMERARAALDQHADKILHRDYVAMVDFSAASAESRLHLVHMETGWTKSMLVAHGKGSDPAHTGWVQRFSNAMGSEASSNGAFLTGDVYNGEHGASRRLIGLDPENDQAENRAIVIHAAWYVNALAAFEQGKIGRSQGCFAVSQGDNGFLLSQFGPGRLLFADKA